MENTTNGLIMAGSVLIGVIVLSLFVYLFSSMGSTAKEFQETVDKTAILKFNESFEKYVGREDITPHEVLTAFNLAKEKNEEAGETIMTIKGISNNLINDEAAFLTSGKVYKCESKSVKYSDITQKIVEMEFKEVK